MGGEPSKRKSRAITCLVGLKSFCVKRWADANSRGCWRCLLCVWPARVGRRGPLNLQPRSQKPVPGHGDFVDANLLERC
jgi:hypothetical protein